MTYVPPIGAQPDATGTRFRVWAANAQRVEVVLYEDEQELLAHELQPEGEGYFSAHIPHLGDGVQYMYRLDGGDQRPDPASRYQPFGVHGPSQVVDASKFNWTDDGWRGISIEDATIYELHVGTFTPKGTFDSVIDRLDELVALNVTAIQIMPVADFPGERNWGYDGVCLFAPSRNYGGPEGLRRLVDAAHQRGLAVILDVVYNHLGPDGNYLRQFSEHYFTDHHKTPWGDALNFDDVQSEQVREFFLANACYWASEYHLDGLRLDATHAIKDDSPKHILAEIVERVHAMLPEDRHFLFIAEDERNDPRIITPASQGGYGLNAVWADDFHHQLRVALTGEQEGYYADYSGSTNDIVTTLHQGWFYTGQRSKFSGHERGKPSDGVAPPAFVHCIQNHDQVGNRAVGDRLNHSIDPVAYRVASAVLLVSPYLPMLWMGQEWAASTPFLFFTDHNPDLGKLVTEGRRREFEGFTAFAGQEVPDPQDRETFLRSKLNWDEPDSPVHAETLHLYMDLLKLRRESPALRERSRDSFEAVALSENTIALRRSGGDQTLLILINLRGVSQVQLAETGLNLTTSDYSVLLDTEDTRYGGSNAARLEGDTLAIEGPAVVVLRAA